MTVKNVLKWGLGLVLGGASALAANAATVTTTTADGVRLYGEAFFGPLDKTAPLILLFHQGGGDGRGEYEPLAGWLNGAGYRAIAWDQRAGGDNLGNTNRTVAELKQGTPAEYCDAYADLEAALKYVTDTRLAEEVIVWGSSYSAALVFQLAAKHPEQVSAVLAFSPASGGPLEECRARQWLDDLKSPALVLRPEVEMERESSQEQKDILQDAGVAFHVVKNGVHGSSMLVDERTESDMSSTRTMVLEWLTAVQSPGWQELRKR